MLKFFSVKKKSAIAKQVLDFAAYHMLLILTSDKPDYFTGVWHGITHNTNVFDNLFHAIDHAKMYMPDWSYEEYQLFHLIYDHDRIMTRKPILEPITQHVRNDAPGYVYLVKSDTGHYKIGKTVNVDDRRKTFSVKLPFEIEFENVIKCRDYHTIESNLHFIFRNQRVNGEWFWLTRADVNWLKSIKEID